jgi:microcompartment protein CcmK/EutM
MELVKFDYQYLNMQFARIIGNVVSTRKEGKVQGLKILLARYLDEDLHETAKTAACIDTVGAGTGDIVMLCSSSSARMTYLTKGVCTDNTVVGIVDTISNGHKTIYSKIIDSEQLNGQFGS